MAIAATAVMLLSVSITSAERTSLRFELLDSPQPPHRSIYSLCQDAEGFIWIGTQDGLARYDGYEMVTFRHDPDNPQSLSNNSVRMLFEDSQGRLWVGTENGLNIFDRGQRRFVRVATPGHPVGSGAWFRCAFEDRQGGLWFGTEEGLLSYDSVTGFRSVQDEADGPDSLTGAAVVRIQQDRAGNLWVATTTLSSYTLYRLTPASGVVGRYPMAWPTSHQYAFLIDSRDRFWIHPSAPMRFDSTSSELSELSQGSGCLETRAAVEGASGTVWFACDDGLYRVDSGDGEVTRHAVVESAGAWLENYGRCLLEDRSGTLWVGTEGGVYRCDPHAKAFTHICKNPENPETLSANAVSAVAETRDGTLWVATYGGGLNRVDRVSGRVRHLCVDPIRHDRCTSPVIWHLHGGADGRLWIAGDELWSVDSDGETLTRHSPNGAILGYIVYLVEDDNGGLWMGGLAGRLYRYSIPADTFEVIQLDFPRLNQETHNRFDSLLLDGATLWIGMGDALGMYDTRTGSLETVKLETSGGASLSSLGTWFIHKDPSGDLWLGSGLGLIRYTVADGRFRLLTTHDGLPGSAVYSILEDDGGVLWLGTNQGLARLDRSRPEGQQLRSFTAADGTGNVEFNRHAALCSADGTMVFGGMDGLTSFRPAQIRDNSSVPPVVITEIEIFSREGVRTVSPHGLERLVLAPTDTTVSFRFAALSFTAPERNTYAYRLEGFERSWIDAGQRRTTQYTNLPPGAYRLMVKGSNNDGIWNEEGLSLEVVVRPAFWETWWFHPLIGCVVLGAAWLVYRYREAKKREMERLRVRIAGDLHDDLSSDLSGVAVVADMVRQADVLGAAERGDLGAIRDASLRMADGLRDIVWYIDPAHDNLEAMVRRMRSVASTLLRGTPHRFSAEIPQRSAPLAVDIRRNVYLVFKEAVHNVVRHAEATRVEIAVALTAGKLRLTVEDNGKGFDPTEVAGGHGVRSMGRRAEDIGGKLEIRPTPGGGTTVALTVQMARSRDGRRRRRGPMLEAESSGGSDAAQGE
jgi:ligand-binding sensor domain-containing protein/signal transduction histidine kinase